MKTIQRVLLSIILSSWFFFLKSQQPIFSNPVVEKLADGFNFVEGPVWVDGLGCLFSDIPENKVYLFGLDSSVTVYKTPSGNSNGLALDLAGNLLLAQHGLRQVARLDGSEFTPLATHYEEKKLNSPNDMVVHSDGSVFFTDPPYGISAEQEELGYYGIYRLTSEGRLYLLDNTLNRPNGLSLSPDESILYVGDSEGRTIYVWNIMNDSVISEKTEFAFMNADGYTDGMKTDENGFLYSSGPYGIWVFHPDGTPLDTIPVPGQTTNCAIGGEDGKTLFVTSGNSLYRIVEKEESIKPVGIKKVQDSNLFQLKSIPNPAENLAVISFFIPKSQSVEVSILDCTGKIVNKLGGNYLKSGYHEIEWKTQKLQQGFYYVVLSAGKNIQTIKCLHI